MLPNIPLSYSPIDPVAINNTLDQYQGVSHERMIYDFETKLSVLTDAKFVVALSSGTGAIHLALKAVGVGSQDEVIVSTFTYVATINPILYLGARPIFIDVEGQSWNMDPELLEIAIKDRINKGSKPKAILVVHTYGMPARMEQIMNISQRYEIPVIEDAAEALGSTIGGKSVGTFGKIGILSFNNNKILTTYGGGAILTEDGGVAERILFWAGQSRESKLYYEHKELGYNYRMGPINAAVGLSKMDKLESEISLRRRCFEVYNQALAINGFHFQQERPRHFSNRWLSTVCLRNNSEVEVMSKILGDHGVETRRVWKPMHQQPVFKDAPFYSSFYPYHSAHPSPPEKGSLPAGAASAQATRQPEPFRHRLGDEAVSENLFATGLCLPSGSNLSKEDLDRVVSIIKKQFSS